ncbi:MAG: hypothetical protein AAF543_08250 [Pseudomonadota bacterium]
MALIIDGTVVVQPKRKPVTSNKPTPERVKAWENAYSAADAGSLGASQPPAHLTGGQRAADAGSLGLTTALSTPKTPEPANDQPGETATSEPDGPMTMTAELIANEMMQPDQPGSGIFSDPILDLAAPPDLPGLDQPGGQQGQGVFGPESPVPGVGPSGIMIPVFPGPSIFPPTDSGPLDNINVLPPTLPTDEVYPLLPDLSGDLVTPEPDDGLPEGIWTPWPEHIFGGPERGGGHPLGTDQSGRTINANDDGDEDDAVGGVDDAGDDEVPAGDDIHGDLREAERGDDVYSEDDVVKNPDEVYYQEENDRWVYVKSNGDGTSTVYVLEDRYYPGADIPDRVTVIPEHTDSSIQRKLDDGRWEQDPASDPWLMP